MNMILQDHIPDYEAAQWLETITFRAKAKCAEAEAVGKGQWLVGEIEKVYHLWQNNHARFDSSPLSKQRRSCIWFVNGGTRFSQENTGSSVN